MVFDYNINGAELPWIYKNKEYAGKLSDSFGGFILPKVKIGNKYITKLSSLGWAEVIIKSFVWANDTPIVIVIAPNGKEYGVRWGAEFFNSIEDAKVRAANPNYDDYIKAVGVGCSAYIRRENVLKNYSNIEYKGENCFLGYQYKNNAVEEVFLKIEYLWVDKDGIHYRIKTSDDMPDDNFIYSSKENCIETEFSALKFKNPDNNTPIKKYCIVVEVYAENLEQAKNKIVIK